MLRALEEELRAEERLSEKLDSAVRRSEADSNRQERILLGGAALAAIFLLVAQAVVVRTFPPSILAGLAFNIAPLMLFSLCLAAHTDGTERVPLKAFWLLSIIGGQVTTLSLLTTLIGASGLAGPGEAGFFRFTGSFFILFSFSGSFIIARHLLNGRIMGEEAVFRAKRAADQAKDGIKKLREKLDSLAEGGLESREQEAEHTEPETEDVVAEAKDDDEAENIQQAALALAANYFD